MAYISESLDAGVLIKNERIYVISDIEIIPLFSSNTYYRCFKDIISLYQSNCFFYSYSYDLSQSMQRQYERNSNNITAPYIYHWNTVDKSFVVYIYIYSFIYLFLYSGIIIFVKNISLRMKDLHNTSFQLLMDLFNNFQM